MQGLHTSRHLSEPRAYLTSCQYPSQTAWLHKQLLQQQQQHPKGKLLLACHLASHSSNPTCSSSSCLSNLQHTQGTNPALQDLQESQQLQGHTCGRKRELWYLQHHI
jgi:hypothetical protein